MWLIAEGSGSKYVSWPTCGAMSLLQRTQGLQRAVAVRHGLHLAADGVRAIIWAGLTTSYCTVRCEADSKRGLVHNGMPAYKRGPSPVCWHVTSIHKRASSQTCACKR